MVLFHANAFERWAVVTIWLVGFPVLVVMHWFLGHKEWSMDTWYRSMLADGKLLLLMDYNNTATNENMEIRYST